MEGVVDLTEGVGFEVWPFVAILQNGCEVRVVHQDGECADEAA